ncbi:MAG: sugar transferase [Campylobacter concisus]|jgi:undecaprenyl-phosphate galactose phosphotransferase|nr:sugar transferase [Campylobacter concisus]
MKQKLCNFIILATDIFGIWLSFGIAVILKNLLYGNNLLLDIAKYQGLVSSYLIMVFLLFYQGVYTRRYDFWHESRILVKSSLFAFLLSFAFLASIKINYDFSRLSLLFSFMAMAIILPILKLVAKKMLYQIGMWQENAKVIGKNSSFEKQIFSNHYLGYAKTNDENYKSLLIGEVATDASSLNKLIEQNIKENKEIIFAPILQGYDFTQAYIYNIFNSRINLIALQNSLQNRFKTILKRTLDIFLIILALPLLIIIFLVVALLIKVQEPNGRVFFSHKRMGFKGKPFGCLKFRSMKENSDEILRQYLKENPQETLYFEKYHKYEKDPRVTKFGNFIRKTSIDELPQLINVLKGEMSIVGPRPCAEYEHKDMGEFADLILAVKPGITGIWQVSGRSDVDFATRAKMDAWYMKNWSIWYDIVIIIKTFGVVLSRKGAS